MSTTTGKQRVFGLDILRTIAILTVVIGHIFLFLPNAIDKGIARLVFIDGVTIFFVLSGFLIGTILLKTLDKKEPTVQNLFRFWKDRWWRTLPLYLFVLVLVAAISIYKGINTIQHFLPYPFFLQNLKTGMLPAYGESWSLAVEEWFYLTTPVLFFIGVRFMPLRKAVPLIVLLIIIAANALRVFKIHHYSIDQYMEYVYDIIMCMPTRIDSVMYGVLGACMSFYNVGVWTKYKKDFLAIGLIGFFANHIYGSTADFNNYILYAQKQVELIFVLMTIPYFSTLRSGNGPIAKAVTFISTISYSIYLAHASLFLLYVQPLLPDNFWIQLPVYLLWAFGAAYVLNRTIERWGMNQRDKRKDKEKPRQEKQGVHSHYEKENYL